MLLSSPRIVYQTQLIFICFFAVILGERIRKRIWSCRIHFLSHRKTRRFFAQDGQGAGFQGVFENAFHVHVMRPWKDIMESFLIYLSVWLENGGSSRITLHLALSWGHIAWGDKVASSEQTEKFEKGICAKPESFEIRACDIYLVL